MHLDFLHPRRAPSPWGWLVLVAGLLACGIFLDWYLFQVRPQLQLAEADLSRTMYQLGQSESGAVRLSDKQLESDWKRAAKVAQELGAPWVGVFRILDQAVDQPVALLSVDIDSVRREVVLTGEARNYHAMLAYYSYLQKQKTLAGVDLQLHQVNQQDGDRPVRFRITALWDGAV
jgi:Tfp pilus assembly protein PilN